MPRLFAAVLMGLLTAGILAAEKDQGAADIPASPAKAEDRDGYEAGRWEAENFGNPIEARVVRAADKNQLLCVHYRVEGSDKGALKRMTGLVASEKGTLRVCVYSGELSPPRVAFALCTGEKYNWHETESVRLKSGWNELAFELGGKKWKNAATDWRNEAALADRNDVRAMDFIVYGKHDSVLYLDAVKIDRDDKVAGIDELIKKLSADEFAERETAEKSLLDMGRKALEAINDVVENAQDPELLMRAKRIQAQLSGTGWQRAATGGEPRRRLEDVEVGE